MTRWITLLGLAAVLAGCGNLPPAQSTAQAEWDGGIWNSVLGYHGPANATVVGGPASR
jgi:hypothetical protein